MPSVRPRSLRRGAARRAAFTLLEILIVVTLTSIIAGATLTAMTDSATDAKDATLRNNLRGFRIQIEMFKAQHNGNPPGWNGTNPKLHLTAYSNANGQVIPIPNALFPYGPYLTMDGVTNTINGGTAIKTSTDPANEVPNNALKQVGQLVGWFYDPATGRIAPNAEGTTTDGVPRMSF